MSFGRDGGLASGPARTSRRWLSADHEPLQLAGRVVVPHEDLEDADACRGGRGGRRWPSRLPGSRRPRVLPVRRRGTSPAVRWAPVVDANQRSDGEVPEPVEVASNRDHRLDVHVVVTRPPSSRWHPSSRPNLASGGAPTARRPRRWPDSAGSSYVPKPPSPPRSRTARTSATATATPTRRAAPARCGPTGGRRDRSLRPRARRRTGRREPRRTPSPAAGNASGSRSRPERQRPRRR